MTNYSLQKCVPIAHDLSFNHSWKLLKQKELIKYDDSQSLVPKFLKNLMKSNFETQKLTKVRYCKQTLSTQFLYFYMGPRI